MSNMEPMVPKRLHTAVLVVFVALATSLVMGAVVYWWQMIEQKELAAEKDAQIAQLEGMLEQDGNTDQVSDPSTDDQDLDTQDSTVEKLAIQNNRVEDSVAGYSVAIPVGWDAVVSETEIDGTVFRGLRMCLRTCDPDANETWLTIGLVPPGADHEGLFVTGTGSGDFYEGQGIQSVFPTSITVLGTEVPIVQLIDQGQVQGVFYDNDLQVPVGEGYIFGATMVPGIDVPDLAAQEVTGLDGVNISVVTLGAQILESIELL